jgi:alpha-ketoglutarate-dependent taurine dioxygenase
MSFDTLKVAELKSIAEDFAVETEGLKNKQEIIAALAEEGVTYSVYAKTIKDVEEAKEEIEIIPVFDPKAQRPEDNVLVMMTRENFRYDILGQTFTQQHPYVSMHKDQAQQIFDIEEGFRLATPKEVQDYYS